MWASDDPRTYHDSLHVMGRHEVKRGAAGILVEPRICLGRIPALQRRRFGALREDHADCYLCGSAGVWSVVRDRCDWVAPEASS